MGGISVETHVNSIAKIWQTKRTFFLFLLTFLVLILLWITSVKLIVYGIVRPHLLDRVKDSAFDLVMTYRLGISENDEDAFFKAVNREPHVFLRAAAIMEENKNTEEKDKK